MYYIHWLPLTVLDRAPCHYNLRNTRDLHPKPHLLCEEEPSTDHIQLSALQLPSNNFNFCRRIRE